MKPAKLRVVKKTFEANDAVSIVFEVPPELKPKLSYKPGQFITLGFEIDSQKVRRAYSISSCPVVDENLRITVKRIKNGLVSNHIHDCVHVGDMVAVMPPGGRFAADVAATNYKTYYLFGAGSGITPLFSILRSVLNGEPKSNVFLLFGNRDETSIIFGEELVRTAEQFPERLKIVHTFSNSKTKQLKFPPSFETRNGRIDEEAIRSFFAQNPPVSQDAQYYICGPGSMIEAVEKALLQIGVPEQRIHLERFATNKKTSPAIDVNIVDTAFLEADVKGELNQCQVGRGQTLLRALLDAGPDIPYSCESGVCGTCRAQIISGSVTMDSTAALTADEVDQGHILTCQARPTSEKISIRVR